MTAQQSFNGGQSISTSSHASGKFMLEFSGLGWTNGGSSSVGFANGSWNVNGTYILGADANSIGIRMDGSYFVGGGAIGGGPNGFWAAYNTPQPGDIIDVAIDITADLMWIRRNGGAWNPNIGGTQNPATDTGGISIAAVTGALFVAGAAAEVGDSITANYGATSFNYSAPSGYTSWDGGGTPASTWDTTHQGTNITLSNGDLTALVSATGWGTGTNAVLSTPAKSSGKRYFEITVNAIGGSNGMGFIAMGLANQSYDMSYLAGRDAGGNSLGWQDNGYVFSNNVAAPFAADTYTTGTVLCFAVDLDAKQIWMQKAVGGSWNGGTGNPTAGTGGYSFGFAGPWVAIFTGPLNSATEVTANFGATSFTGTVPSGFENWQN